MLRRLLSNAAISLTGQVVTWSSTLLLTLAYGRFLGDTKFGELYFAITFITLLGIPAGGDSGYDIQITRHIARDPNQGTRYLANVLAIKVSTWTLIYALALLISWILGYSTETRVLVGICGLSLLTSTVGASLSSVQYAYERAAYPVIASIVEKTIGAALGITVLALGGGVRGMATVLLIGSLASVVWQAFWFFRLVRGPFAIDRALLRELVRANVPFLLYGLIGTAYFRIDVLILSVMTNDTVVGWYGAGYRLFETLSFIPAMMFMLLYPLFSKLALQDQRGLKLATEKAVNFALLSSAPIATALIVAAPSIIHVLYHRPGFDHGVPSLQALAPGLIFLYVNMALGIAFLNTKQDRKLPIQAVVALIFNLSLNLLLIPLYAHVGAAITTTLTELLLVGIGLYLLPPHLRPVRSLTTAGKSFAASVVMGLAMSYLQALGIFAVPLGLITYGIVVVWIGAFERADLLAVRSAIQARLGASRRAEGSDARSIVDDSAPVAIAAQMQATTPTDEPGVMSRSSVMNAV